MFLLQIFLIFITSLNSGQSLELPASFVFDFLNEMKLSCGVLFHCDYSLDIRKWNELNENHMKFLTFYDTSKRSLYVSEIDKIMRTDHLSLGVIIDTTCNETEDILEISSELNFFYETYKWIMLSANYSKSTELLSHKNINLNAEITLAIMNDKNISLYDVYNPSFKYNAQLVITEKGIYDSKAGLNMTLKGSKLSQRKNLQGIKINVGVVATGIKPNQTVPEYMESYENPGLDAQHRHQYRLHKMMSEKYNFSLYLHRSITWGFIRNGTYDGLLRMFQYDEIDFSITPFRHTLDRSYFIDHTITTFETTPKILFRHPKNSIRNPFLLPLSPLVWCLIIFIIIITSIFVTLTMRNDKVKNVTFVRAFMTSIGVMCQQGFMENFIRPSTRSLLIVLITFSTIIYQFYSSFIVSSLLITPPKTINSLRQLIDSQLEVGFEDIVYNHLFFETTADKTSIELYKKKGMTESGSGNFMSVECGIERMREGGFAFLVDTAYAYRYIIDSFDDDQICEIHQLTLLVNRPLSCVFAKKSPFKEMLRVEMLRFKENGLYQYHDTKWRKKKPKCVQSITKVKAVDIEDTSQIFVFLATMTLGSFLILLMEVLYFKYSERIDIKQLKNQKL